MNYLDVIMHRHQHKKIANIVIARKMAQDKMTQGKVSLKIMGPNLTYPPATLAYVALCDILH